MNQSKLKYARERLNNIAHSKIQAIPSVVTESHLDINDALRLLRNGSVTINWNTVGKSKDRWGHRENIATAIVRQVVGRENAAIDKRNRKASNAHSKACAKIRKAAQLVEDELVLGDETRAMALLEQFANS